MNIKLGKQSIIEKLIIILILIGSPFVADCQIDTQNNYYKSVYKIEPVENKKRRSLLK